MGNSISGTPIPPFNNRWKADIENVSIERLREFYDTLLANNATAIAIGDFSEPDALAMIKKHFGKIRKARNQFQKSIPLSQNKKELEPLL